MTNALDTQDRPVGGALTHYGTQAQRDARYVLDRAAWSAQDCRSGTLADHVAVNFGEWVYNLSACLDMSMDDPRFNGCQAELAVLGFRF